MKSKDIRNTFLNFFKNKHHLIVSSAPMVLKNDPTLLFVNSGMAPFKDFFLDNNTPKNKRIADNQKCLRVSGKHNDLEEVGYDTYHHTFFEMLGNWSFGDYFKKEAIAWAWELLTQVYKINKDQLYVTVFEGNSDDSLSMDTEAYTIWKKFIAEDRILKGNKKDNFWEMGDKGPCGPCSEIHVDVRSKELRAKVDGKTLVNSNHPQVVEIWNLVFIQYNRKANGILEILPKKHIDTGMGFERLCMVLQNVSSNYDTDIFTAIINKIESLTNTKYKLDVKVDVAIRVVADHTRAVAFSIADGQLPTNTGAGYVIRRILRRAVRYGFTFLNQKKPFIYKLVRVLAQDMGEAFPELIAQQQLIEKVIKKEEQSFLKTLDQGLVLLDKLIKTSTSNTINGAKAFELYDTFGFPLDLTQLIANEHDFKVDVKVFEAEMLKQKERSRIASASETFDWIILAKEDSQPFIGYDNLTANVKITRYRKVSSKKEGEQYQLVFNTTPFYPEGGGQLGDTGIIRSPDGNELNVLDTQKENNIIIHITKQLPKTIGSTFKIIVNKKKRELSASNHTATHILHQALRQILGVHVEQKGSLVRPQNLRFDFSHFSKVDDIQLKAIEDFVNNKIQENLILKEHRKIPMQEAIAEGAVALFGEKYGNTVRTIRFGESIELCGGTHVERTSNIWYFKIRSESAVASGIRRIEAITNESAKAYFETLEQQMDKIKITLKNADEPIKAVQIIQESNTILKKQVEKLLKEKATNLIPTLIKELKEVNGIQFLAKKLDLDADGIKNICFELGNKYNNLFLLFGAKANEKAILSCYISKEVVTSKGMNASIIVRDLGKYIQGSGGGQPFFATAGGKYPEGIKEALKHAEYHLIQ